MRNCKLGLSVYINFVCIAGVLLRSLDRYNAVQYEAQTSRQPVRVFGGIFTSITILGEVREIMKSHEKGG